MTIFSTDKLTV